MRGTCALALGVVIAVGSACGGSASKLVKKGDQRLTAGNAKQALANYDEAIKKQTSAGKDVGKPVQVAREHAATLVGIQTLDEAQKLYSSKQYENALDTLWSLHKTNAFGISWMDNQLVKVMGDIVTKLWDEVDAFAIDKHYDLAVLKAEYYVAPFPAGHAHRLRLEALYEEAATYHSGRMRQTKTQPAAAAFHYKMSRRFGAPRSPDGEKAVQEFAEWVAELAKIGANGGHLDYAAVQAANANALNKVEEYLVLAYGLDGTLSVNGQEWFGTSYGLGADGFQAIMNDTTLPIGEPQVAAMTLPSPDDVSSSFSGSRRDDDDDDEGGGLGKWPGEIPFGPAMLFGNILSGDFTVRGSGLPNVGHTRGFGINFRLRERDKVAYQARLYFETAVIGGDAGGWGLEYRKLAPAKESLVFGYGFGYSSQEATTRAIVGDNEANECQFQRSLYFTFFTGTQLMSWLTVDVQWQANILRLFGQADGEAALNNGDDGHYSPFVFTFSMPLYKKFFLTGTVNYAAGAEEEAYFGVSLNRAFLLDDD